MGLDAARVVKIPHAKFPEAAIREAGYGIIRHGHKGFNGGAILARGADPGRDSPQCCRATLTISISSLARDLTTI